MAKKKGRSYRSIYVIEWYDPDCGWWMPEEMRYDRDSCIGAVISKRIAAKRVGIDADYRIRKYIPQKPLTRKKK